MDTEPDYSLEAAPDADAIETYRQEAEAGGDSVIAAYPSADGETRYLVTSPRGTCSILDDRSVSLDTFNQSVDAADVASGL